MIDFSKTEEQELLIESIKELLEREMPAEKERECYRNGEFPWDLEGHGRGRLHGLGLPEEVGGTDVDLMTVALANFTISRYAARLRRSTPWACPRCTTCASSARPSRSRST